jgi:hypothetical protein
MKKIFASAIGLSMVAFPFITFADVDCTLTPGACGGGPDVTQLQMSWGLKAADTPMFQVGSSVKDTYGNVYECPFWFPKVNGGCYDLTKTPYYLNQVHSFLNIK